MTQYQHQESSDAPKDKPPLIQNREIDSLRQQLAEQSREIDSLKRVMRKLQNEVRLAVNNFNLKNHG